MQYMLLIYANEESEPRDGAPEQLKRMERYGRFTEEVTQAGMFGGGNRLRAVSDATTIRIRDGQTLITDGPFAETREQLGGYYLLDCKDLDEAIAMASKLPAAETGSVEVRPIFVM